MASGHTQPGFPTLYLGSNLITEHIDVYRNSSNPILVPFSNIRVYVHHLCSFQSINTIVLYSMMLSILLAASKGFGDLLQNLPWYHLQNSSIYSSSLVKEVILENVQNKPRKKNFAYTMHCTVYCPC